MRTNSVVLIIFENLNVNVVMVVFMGCFDGGITALGVEKIEG